MCLLLSTSGYFGYSGPGADVMAILSIASFISLSLIMISERLFPFCCGFNNTSGMSFGVVKTDLYFSVSMLASFFGSSS